MDLIVCLGDSLTQRGYDLGGWVSLLSNAYARKLDVINRGFGGYTSEWFRFILNKILSDLPKAKIKLFIVFLGANDAVIEGQKQSCEINRFVDNLKFIKESLAAKFTSSEILFVTPPCLYLPDWDHYRSLQGRPCDRTVERTKMYSQAVVSLCSQLNLPVVDSYSAIISHSETSDTNLKEYFCDGLHFSSLGNSFLYNELQTTINKNFSHLDPSALELYFPHHEAVDIHDLNKTFNH